MKFQRQAKILDLIEQTEIETQEELSEHLRRLGYATTQATVSRDIKDLRLIKTLSSTSGKYKYAAATSEIENSFTTRLRNIFKECVTEISHAQNMVGAGRAGVQLSGARAGGGDGDRRDAGARGHRDARRRRHGVCRDA